MLRTREMSAKVPEKEFNRFRNHVTSWGAATWFINTALREFNDRMDREPSLQDHVRESVERMLREEPDLETTNGAAAEAG